MWEAKAKLARRSIGFVRGIATNTTASCGGMTQREGCKAEMGLELRRDLIPGSEQNQAVPPPRPVCAPPVMIGIDAGRLPRRGAGTNGITINSRIWGKPSL